MLENDVPQLHDVVGAGGLQDAGEPAPEIRAAAPAHQRPLQQPEAA